MKKYHFQETTTESEIKDKGLNVFKEALVIKSLKWHNYRLKEGKQQNVKGNVLKEKVK